MIQTFASFVVYIDYDEKSPISHFLRGLDSYLNNTFAHYEIILVDDSTNDKIHSILVNEAKSLKSHVIILDLAYHHGVENGMLAGLEVAMGDYVFEFDSIYRNYPFDLLQELLKQSSNGFDVVFAQSDHKKPLNSLFEKTFDRIFHYPKNLQRGIIAIISRRALNNILSFLVRKNINKFIYRNSLYALTGYPIKTIYYNGLENIKMPKQSKKQHFRNALYFKLLFFDLKFIHFFIAFFLLLLPQLLFALADHSNFILHLPFLSVFFILLSFLGLHVIFLLFLMYMFLLLRNQYHSIYKIKKIETFKAKDQIVHFKH